MTASNGYKYIKTKITRRTYGSLNLPTTPRCSEISLFTSETSHIARKEPKQDGDGFRGDTNGLYEKL